MFFYLFYQDRKQISNSFLVNQNDLYEESILNNTVCNLQPFQKVGPRVFPHSLNSKENLQSEKFSFSIF